MEHFTNFITTIDSFLGSSQWFVFVLLGTGLFFTIYLRFPQVRYFGYAIKVLRGKHDNAHSKGDTSHFGALSTALSGTIGTGNIAGVALAIHLGGPSALFWMLVTAVLGMATKMVEVTLSHKYREVASDGTISGGPMYYMKNGLKMKWLAVIFAVATIFSSFGTGSLPQINSIASSFETTFGVNRLLIGITLAVILGFITIGGIKRIAKVSERLVPAMAIIYIVGGIGVLITNYDNILPSIGSIFGNVISGTAATGGFLGAGFAWAFNRGVNRGLFSNEAGQGSAPIAHAAAKTDKSISEGAVALLEPFIDTVIVCFTTGIILLSSGAWSDKIETKFEMADTYLLNPCSTSSATAFILNEPQPATLFDGTINVNNGTITTDITFIHNRSIAQNIVVTKNDDPYNGQVQVVNGKPTAGFAFNGESLLHSAPLTSAAYSRSVFGKWGGYIIPLSLLLFAFSTALAWSYYGNRAITFLFGVKWVRPFQVIYIVGFALGSVIDTSVIWAFSGVTIAFMALPNLFGILMLHKDMRAEVRLKDKEGR